MKFLPLYVLVSIILFSCGGQPIKINSVTRNTDSSAKITVRYSSDLDSASPAKLLLIARGSEPGWYAEFYNDSVKLQLDYGKIKCRINRDFHGINNEKGYNKTYTIESDHGSNVPAGEFKVIIEIKPCVEDGSGEKRDRSAQLSFAGKIYRGCATAL